MSSPVRTPDGYKSNFSPLSGAQDIPAASPSPQDVEVVQTLTISNAGGAATLVANLPKASDLFGRGFALYAVTAAVAPADVDFTPQSGDTVNGGAVFNVAAAGVYLANATSKTNILLTQVA